MTESQDKEGSLLDKILKATGIESIFQSGEFAVEKFRVPDRGSGNPTPLGGWDCSASDVDWLDGSVQTRQPYRLYYGDIVLR
jgi:hypothetical protein